VQLTRSEHEADEILQEVFLKCWLKKEELVWVHNFNAWLHTIARHLFIDQLRRIAREEEELEELRLLSTEQTTSIDHFILDKENELLLRQSIERLSLQQRTVFELSRRQGLNRGEIALQMGISENTVRVHLTRALASMRDFLSRHADLSVVLLLLWSRRS
jgi:RNA polymerase sigma-70 factor (ECF subfamily)